MRLNLDFTSFVCGGALTATIERLLVGNYWHAGAYALGFLILFWSACERRSAPLTVTGKKRTDGEE